MTSYTTELRRMLSELEETRRHLDDDIADLHRILARHDGAASEAPPPSTTSPGAGRGGKKGETREAILQVMEAHPPGPWRVAEVAALLPGKSKGSLSTAMIRMVRANLLEDAGYGLYRIPAKTPLGPGGESGADTPDATRLTLHEGGHGEESD